MTLDSKTLMPLHELTEEGKLEYKRLLECYADEIIWKHRHPFLNILQIVRETLGEITGED